MKITFAEEGWNEYLYWQVQIRKPEPLKYGKSGSFSRRIDEALRMVQEDLDSCNFYAFNPDFDCFNNCGNK